MQQALYTVHHTHCTIHNQCANYHSFGGGGSLIRIKEAKEEVKWFFEVETIPRERTTFSWLLPNGEEVPHKELEKYTKEVEGSKVKLVIKVGGCHSHVGE